MHRPSIRSLALAALSMAALAACGDPVTVIGSVRTMSAERAADIRSSIEAERGEGDGVAERAYADTRIERGAPYIELIELEGTGS